MTAKRTLKQYAEATDTVNLYDLVIKTPLQDAKKLSARFHNKIILKREDFQPVFSFKLRGAFNKMLNLSDEQKKNGVIAASAGNHAQGVALAAKHLGIQACIVMPKTTPSIKVKAVQGFGGQTVLIGDSYDDAYHHALELQKEKNLTFVHPFDDADVITGQGTVAKEILEVYTKPIYAIFVPIGGGGLVAGITAYIKALRPDIKVIGVEPDDAACMAEALKAGKRVTLDKIGIFADGVAVKQIGEEPFRVCKDHLDEVITVTTDEICAAIKDIFDDTRTITEPAGALAVAGIKKYCETTAIKHQTLIAINSGANMNFDRLRYVAERAEIGEHREALFAVTIPEKPGSFRTFCKILGKRSITEFNYRFTSKKSAQVFVGLELQKGLEEKNKMLQALFEANYPVLDLTDNEMAKLHVRHMVGGKTDIHETLYRVEFPERPGALLLFLNSLDPKWNITLFHYRNHGAAYGRVLVGLSLNKNDISQFESVLKQLDYPFSNETQNPAYSLFL